RGTAARTERTHGALRRAGRVWEGMGFATEGGWLDITLADRKPIPTPALPLKGRGKSGPARIFGARENSRPPRPLVDLRGGVKAIQRRGESQRHAAAVPAHHHFAVLPAQRLARGCDVVAPTG